MCPRRGSWRRRRGSRKGNTLGGVCAQVLIALSWRGLASRADFEAVQASAQPVLESLRR
jgi:hypothetical protein